MSDVMWHGPGNIWKKTANGGWEVYIPADDTDTPDNDQELSKSTSNDVLIRPVQCCPRTISARPGRQLCVQGHKGQRRIVGLSACLSEALELFDIKSSVLHISRFRYIYDLMKLLIENYIHTVSGTAQRQIIEVLVTMVTHAIETERNINEMRKLIAATIKTVENRILEGEVGNKRLWKHHLQTVTNLGIQLNNFNFTQRELDGKTLLSDLPKECLLGIMMIFSDPQDVLNLGAANEDLYHVSRDRFLWQRLAGHHYTEKQIMKYLPNSEPDEDLNWMRVFAPCYKKFGLKKSYSDLLVVCCKCKTMIWRYQDHVCICNHGDEEVDRIHQSEAMLCEPISPEEFIQIIRL